MKRTFVLIAALAMLAIVAAPVLAGQPPMGNRGRVGPAGNSNVGLLELWEKDLAWNIVEDGAWGKMTYSLSGPEFSFVFNGHKLEPGTAYTLIYYPDDWPNILCLGEGTANRGGNINIKGSVATGDLTEAKIWLVLSADVDCEAEKMTAWNPSGYLFEYAVIDYEETSD
jgi:hypothetical protein